MQGNHAIVPASLMAEAQAHPDQLFSVIVQGKPGTKSSSVANAVVESTDARPGKAKGLKRTFSSVSGVAAQLTGAQIVELAGQKGILAITPDSKIRLSVANGGFSSNQTWVSAASAADVWSGTLRPPAIAVVDSGVQACRADFSDTGAGCNTRVVARVTMTSLLPNSNGDGRGHGTLVAGLAAGSRDGYAGVAPTAPIVSIDVMDDNGMAVTSDVIAAADWILANKSRYNIRVANFSLQSTVSGSFMYDPLNKAVEKLWFNGVVVVVAAGNYGVDGLPTTVAYAPGNDPFVITVGAADLERHPHEPRRRLRGSVVGLRLHARRLREAGHRRPGPHAHRACPGHRDDASGAPRARDRQRLHVDVGHVVRGSDRLRRGRAAARQVSELDARPGQGRPHAHRAVDGRRDGARRRRGQPQGRVLLRLLRLWPAARLRTRTRR